MENAKPIVRACLQCGERFPEALFAKHLKMPELVNAPSRTKADCHDTYALREAGWWQSANGLWLKGSV